MTTPDLPEIEPGTLPIFAALGRAVMVCSALENLLLVELAARLIERDGRSDDVAERILDLERQPAGILLSNLKELELSGEVERRVRSVIERRNRIVHRFLQESGVTMALVTGENVEEVVGQLDQLTSDCALLNEELAATAFSSAEQAVGASLSALLAHVQGKDVAELGEEQLRSQYSYIQSLDLSELE